MQTASQAGRQGIDKQSRAKRVDKRSNHYKVGKNDETP
jgi:hypothetical protein